MPVGRRGFMRRGKSCGGSKKGRVGSFVLLPSMKGKECRGGELLIRSGVGMGNRRFEKIT